MFDYNVITSDGAPIVPKIMLAATIVFFVLQLLMFFCKNKHLKRLPIYLLLLGSAADVVIGFGLFGIQILSSDGYPIYTILAAVLITPTLLVSAAAVIAAYVIHAVIGKLKSSLLKNTNT